MRGVRAVPVQYGMILLQHGLTEVEISKVATVPLFGAVGGVIGAIGGSVGGYVYGRKLTETVYDWVFTKGARL